MDEVLSALQVSLRAANGRALFWLWELAVSGESAAALEAAKIAWLLWGGGHDPTILDLPPPDTAITAHTLMWRIQLAIQRAGSLNAQRLLQNATTEPPSLSDTTITTEPPAHDDEPDSAAFVWSGLASAVVAKNRRVATWYLQVAAQNISPDTVWLFFRVLCPPQRRPILELFKSHATPHTDSQLLHQTNTLLAICEPPDSPAPTAPPVSALSKRDWDIWTANTGRRNARVHAIPSAALHQGTTRGRLSSAYTNIGDVRDPGPLLLSGCHFWRTVSAALYMHYDSEHDHLIFPDDDVLEAFYSTYFPDDIPDEWSLADQHKSHGVGCAETAPPAPLPLPMLEGPLNIFELSAELTSKMTMQDE